MTQLEALQIIKLKPWYSPEIYLSTWAEYHMTRHCILTPIDVIGWGPTWEAAIADADRLQPTRRLSADKPLTAEQRQDVDDNDGTVSYKGRK
jgi:hypothetical protein